MRLILKPGGMLVLLLAIIALTMIAFSRRNAASSSSPGAAAAIVTPVAGGAPSAPDHTHEAELIAAPDLASDKWEVLGGDGVADVHVYPSSLPNFPRLRRVTIRQQPQNAWDIQIRQTIPHAIQSGTHLRLRLWARSKSQSPVTVVCEQNTKPYEKLESRTLALTPDWQEYDIDWTADRAVAANWAQIGLQLGAKAGEIELANASLIASTPTP